MDCRIIIVCILLFTTNPLFVILYHFGSINQAKLSQSQLDNARNDRNSDRLLTAAAYDPFPYADAAVPQKQETDPLKLMYSAPEPHQFKPQQFTHIQLPPDEDWHPVVFWGTMGPNQYDPHNSDATRWTQFEQFPERDSETIEREYQKFLSNKRRVRVAGVATPEQFFSLHFPHYVKIFPDGREFVPRRSGPIQKIKNEWTYCDDGGAWKSFDSRAQRKINQYYRHHVKGNPLRTRDPLQQAIKSFPVTSAGKHFKIKLAKQTVKGLQDKAFIKDKALVRMRMKQKACSDAIVDATEDQKLICLYENYMEKWITIRDDAQAGIYKQCAITTTFEYAEEFLPECRDYALATVCSGISIAELHKYNPSVQIMIKYHQTGTTGLHLAVSTDEQLYPPHVLRTDRKRMQKVVPVAFDFPCYDIQKVIPELTEAEADIIEDYTRETRGGGGGWGEGDRGGEDPLYVTLNKELRKTEGNFDLLPTYPEDIQSQAKELDHALGKLQNLDYKADKKLMRTQWIPRSKKRQFEKGKKIFVTSFWSTTKADQPVLGQGVQPDWCKDVGGCEYIIFHIQMIGFALADIQDRSVFPNEMEVLLRVGGQFEITKVDGNNIYLQSIRRINNDKARADPQYINI